MCFGSTILKKDFDQFYTPDIICIFIANLIKDLFSNKKINVIDPAGGSGDFIIHSSTINKNVIPFLWDISKDSCDISEFNCLLNNIKNCSIQNIDSIKNFSLSNNFFDVVITNPPFGQKTILKDSTILSNYELGRNRKKQQLGILFIERSLSLLKENGLLCIILPNGYLSSPSFKYIRDYILKYSNIEYIISLPKNTFKRAGTGVDTSLLIIRKTTKHLNSFKWFISKKIGYNLQTKCTPLIYKKNKDTGNFLLQNNKKLLDNDLVYSKNLFFSSKISDLDEHLTLSPEKIKSSLEINNGTELKTLATIINTTKFKPKDDKSYYYLEISNVNQGSYNLSDLQKGWELPNRAKIELEKNDILVSKLKGTTKFCIISQIGNIPIIASNGFYVIKIKNESKRLKVYSFLFTKRFSRKMNELAIGSIMAEVKLNDFIKIKIDYNEDISTITKYIENRIVLDHLFLKLHI